MHIQHVLHYFDNEQFLQQYGLSKIGIFGSIARGESADDLDLLIDADPKYFKKWSKLKEKIETDLQIRVDIMFEKYADPIILHRAKKDVIYAAQH
ncbi:MAG: nucleotidyltransferase domain-containing protein [Spirosomaceae bacterium]|jgi:hypothetical protein|nr:nucleotidyltransferase domain-containing protein [Spirosomataceae bacterium]